MQVIFNLLTYDSIQFEITVTANIFLSYFIFKDPFVQNYHSIWMNLNIK